ncbi:MAG: hypothetical protein IJ743_03765 [Bacilli bacterium]|nr:hypothetical protein [Bacilli bacterium]
MSVSFKDCEYRFEEKNKLYCKNNEGKPCDNCKQNVHLNCSNYVPKNDMCLLYFELGVSEVSQYNECAEKSLFSDKELSRKWSN